MNVLEGLKYSEDHEWVKVEGGEAYIGITDYAQNSLGDIVFFELPEVGTELKAGDILSSVDSVKAASEIYTPIAGTVVKVNDKLVDAPELANEEPYESWIAVLSIDDKSELDSLMEADKYEEYCDSEDA